MRRSGRNLAKQPFPGEEIGFLASNVEGSNSNIKEHTYHMGNPENNHKLAILQTTQTTTEVTHNAKFAPLPASKKIAMPATRPNMVV